MADVLQDDKGDLEEKQPSPTEWAQHWKTELTASRKRLQDFHKAGDKVVETFLNKTPSSNMAEIDGPVTWPLFTSDTQMIAAMLYGRVPATAVTRKFSDADDDEGRVGAEMLERSLNSEIEKQTDPYAASLSYGLLDYLLPGLAVGRVYYEPGFEDVPEEPAKTKTEDDGTVTELAPKVEAHKKKTYECCECCYVHWRDYLWSVERVWNDTRWMAFKTKMSRKQYSKRFGKDKLPLVSFSTKEDIGSAEAEREADARSPLARAEIWEIWDKETKKVFWYAENAAAILDQKDDPLGLDGFFPCPRPMMANLTTNETVPTSDYKLVQNLYREVNLITQKIHALLDAFGVKGFYDKELGFDLQRLFGADHNTILPVNMPALNEKGGIQAAIQWLPLEQMIKALEVLTEQREVTKQGIYEITGRSDIMRGQQAENGTPGEAGVKARFASVRVQAKQDEFARWASDLQRLKGEVMSKHFDPETLKAMSNVLKTKDAQLADAAIALIQSPDAIYRIEVKPEAVAMTDFAQVRQDRSEVVQTLAQFFTAMQPIVAAMPQAMTFVLQLAQSVVAGLRGASVMEGIFDQAIAAAEQQQAMAAANPQAHPQDPKVLAAQLKLQGDAAKAQADMQKSQMEIQGQIQLEQVKAQTDDQREQSQMVWNTREAMVKQQITDSSPLNQAKITALQKRNQQPPGGGAP